jgi:hypothetical protein
MTKWLQTAGRCFKWVLGLSLFACSIVMAPADDLKISYPPVPDWVRELPWNLDTNGSPNPKTTGIRWLDYEAQDRPKIAAEFVRGVQLMENQNGVQDSGSLRFNFDAEFQAIQIHRVVIHRDGQTINCLNPAKVRLIEPEANLDDHVLNGQKTAVVFVEDLRVGDVLEYAYTIQGANPVLAGHFSTSFNLQSDSPVENEQFRVVWDDPPTLPVRLHQTDTPPVLAPFTGGTVYSWALTNVPAVPDEDEQPAAYQACPSVEVSDFPDWQSVVQWALPLYETSPTNLPAELTALLDRWQNTARSNEEKARFALEFVQDNLRYTGIELGPDSYRPADPVATFQKRFGDCKGKVVLLRFLLQQMGITSSPALVNSSVHEAIENWLPSPFAFDHVILLIQLDGQDVWVDPTCSHQGGLLQTRYVPPYGKALLIRPDTTALVDVPRSRPEVARQQIVTSDFVIKDYDQPVAFTVRTEYRGASADDMRDDVASTAAPDLAKNYLNYYTRLYSGIAGNKPLKITDDRLANLMVVEESYVVTNLWTRDEVEKLWKATFYADNLYNVLTDPQTRLRKTPLALAYPQLNQQHVIVHLTDSGWDIPDTSTNIDNPAFTFNYHRQLRGSTVTYDYECRTRLATVPVEMVPSYLVSSGHMGDLLTDTLQRPDGKTPDGINWLTVVITLFTAGTTAVTCFWYWRRVKTHAADAPPLICEYPHLQGLGGWLILLGFGLLLAPVLRVTFIYQHWAAYFSMQVWETVAMPRGDSYHPLYGPLLMYETVINTLMIGLHVLVICFFFGRRQAFPRLFMAYAWANVLFVILDEVGSAMIPSIAAGASGQNHSEAYRAVFYAIIWTLYVLKSRRVKATFTR